MQDAAHTDIIELIPAYALGSLDPEETALVARHLETCARCRTELAAYEGVVADLATAVPTVAPSPDLKNRLMDRVHTAPPTTTAVSPSPTLWQRLRKILGGPRWQPILALTLIVVLLAALVVWRQNNTPPAAQIELTPTDVAPGATGLLEVAANGRNATLTVTGLPDLSPEQQYQLWLIQDGQRESGAVFSVSGDGSASVTVTAKRPLTDYAAFGITIEPAGGSPGPTGDRVLGHNL